MAIGFWINAANNLNTSMQGLSEEQVEFLRSLSVGDRLVLWNNDGKKNFDKQPDYTLKQGK